jgi:dihydroorotate dehydrogenase electron transfer subunit
MKQVLLTIEENAPVARDVYRMVLAGDVSAVTAPGQFLNLALAGKYLRRPISVCDCDGQNVTILYKVVGKGTAQMASMTAGERLDVLTGLGNGFDVSAARGHTLLIGGGIGAAPLYWLARELKARGKKTTAVLGFNSAQDVYYQNEFAALCDRVVIATADGSEGVKGFVTDAMAGLSCDYFYTCGPEPMLKAVYKASVSDGEFSFEERMGCGFGACMGCSCKTITGYKRICRDGPVLRKGEIAWAD